MNTGLFDLGGFQNKSEDSLLNTTIPMSESGETHVAEKPTAKHNEVGVPVPGGDKETPDSKTKNETPIRIPASKEITTSQWNQAMSALKQSFKEAAELLGVMENCTIVEDGDTTMDAQMEFTEAAILESLDSGPYFEKVSRTDKSAVKEIVANLRKNIIKDLKADGLKAYKPSTIARMILQLNFWSMRFWQVVAAVCVEEGNVNDVCKRLTEKYASDLSGYKILPVKVAPSVVDLFRKRFNWKTKMKVFFLMIDKKLDSEVKAYMNSESDDQPANHGDAESKETESKKDNDLGKEPVE